MAKTKPSPRDGSKQRRAYEYGHEYGLSITHPKKPARAGARTTGARRAVKTVPAGTPARKR